MRVLIIWLLLIGVAEAGVITTVGKDYKSTVISVYDADTFTVSVDLGFHLMITETVRLYGIDTPELRTKNLEEKEYGYKAKEYVENLILGKDFDIIFLEEDKYGRYLVDLKLLDGTSLTKDLVKKGYGKEYYGDTKSSWVSEDFK